MMESKKIDYFHKISKALRVLGEDKPDVAVAAVASMRLLMIDAFGEEKQQDLIGQWNEELRGA